MCAWCVWSARPYSQATCLSLEIWSQETIKVTNNNGHTLRREILCIVYNCYHWYESSWILNLILIVDQCCVVFFFNLNGYLYKKSAMNSNSLHWVLTFLFCFSDAILHHHRVQKQRTRAVQTFFFGTTAARSRVNFNINIRNIPDCPGREFEVFQKMRVFVRKTRCRTQMIRWMIEQI